MKKKIISLFMVVLVLFSLASCGGIAGNQGDAQSINVYNWGEYIDQTVLDDFDTTILGMVPLAVSQGVGAEMWRPLGVAVIGGLTVSTIMTLTYTPVMYCVFGKNGIKRRRKQLKKQRELEAYWNEHKSEEMLINAKK